MDDVIEHEVLLEIIAIHWHLIAVQLRSFYDFFGFYVFKFKYVFIVILLYGLYACKRIKTYCDYYLKFAEDEYWEEIGKTASCYALKGLRQQMEDRFIIIEGQHSDRTCLSLYAVLDGHGGDSIVDYAKHYLSTVLFEKLLNLRNIVSSNHDKNGEMILNYHQVLTNEILYLDNLMRRKSDIGDYVGSTVLLTVIDSNKLITANVGDCRAIMYNEKNEVIPLSFDHKPINKRELERIKNNNGEVIFDGVWRVSGILALSRALGDYPLKAKNVVIADPEVLIFDLNDLKPKFIVLATDGLWDIFSNKEAADFINQRLNESHFGAKSITLDALKRGSRDNITVIVVKFQ